MEVSLKLASLGLIGVVVVLLGSFLGRLLSRIKK